MHYNYRENHTDLALLTGRGESDTIGRSWSVKSKYGPEIEALIYRDKKLEQNSSSRKLNRLIKNELINGVPLSAKTVGESNLHDKTNFKTDLPHHQHTTDLQIIFHLDKELIFLESHQNLFADGTFHLVKNVDFHQIYVISVLYEIDNRTFSYPLIFSLMKNRLSSTYDELFKFLKDKFFEKFGRELYPKNFHLDCEGAVLKSIKTTFPNTVIRLCTVHIQRNWRKKMVKTFGKLFEKNLHLKTAWRLLRGTFFLPEYLIKIIIGYIYHEITPLLTPSKAT